jgi:hypothetical protein
MSKATDLRPPMPFHRPSTVTPESSSPPSLEIMSPEVAQLIVDENRKLKAMIVRLENDAKNSNEEEDWAALKVAAYRTGLRYEWIRKRAAGEIKGEEIESRKDSGSVFVNIPSVLRVKKLKFG